jgi:hypothetical protein
VISDIWTCRKVGGCSIVGCLFSFGFWLLVFVWGGFGAFFFGGVFLSLVFGDVLFAVSDFALRSRLYVCMMDGLHALSMCRAGAGDPVGLEKARMYRVKSVAFK